MDRRFDKKDEKPSLFARAVTSVLRAVLIIGLLFYILYHLTNGFSAELRTETVRMYDEAMTFSTKGAIVRREVALEGGSGAVSYRYSNGERVNKGAKVAVVYGGTDASALARVAEIDKTVDFLEAAAEGGDLTALDAISAGRNISKILSKTADSISRGEYGDFYENSDDLLKNFLQREAAMSGSDGTATLEISSLIKEREKLSKSLLGESGAVYAKTAGYFYDFADGGESVFDYENIKTVTLDEYENAVRVTESKTSVATGKIVTLPTWYFVCPVAKEDSVGMSIGKSYSVTFGHSDMTLMMTLEAKNISSDKGVLVFSSSEMPSDFDFSRFQKATVVTDTVSGYRVPSSALRVVDGVVGVYVRSGNTVKFRVADVIYESGAYSFVSTDTEGVTLYTDDEDETNDVYCKGLTLYDNVIVSGANQLRPDRIVN